MSTETENRPMPLPRWTGAAIAGLVLVAAVAMTFRFGLGSALILLAGAALVLFIWLAFRAVQSVTEPDETMSQAHAPSPAEARKTAALRALKDLEYEKAIGNLSDDDYRELEGRYRDEAKRAMRDVDDERKALRARAEKIAERAVDRALARESVVEDDKPVAKKEPEEAAAVEQPVCPECATKNDPDAKFCKQCGFKMAGAA